MFSVLTVAHREENVFKWKTVFYSIEILYVDILDDMFMFKILIVKYTYSIQAMYVSHYRTPSNGHNMQK